MIRHTEEVGGNWDVRVNASWPVAIEIESHPTEPGETRLGHWLAIAAHPQ
jgi:hypothetical protein